MSKSSKKRRRSCLSLSSSEEEKGSNYQDDSRRRKEHIRKKDEGLHKSRTNSQKKSDQDDSRSSRKVKKPLYRLSSTKKEQKPCRKEEKHENGGSVQLHGEGCRSIAEAAGEIKTVEKEPSKPDKRNSASLLDRTTEKKLKDKSDKRCSEESRSKLKKQQMSYKLEASDHRAHRQGLERKSGSAREPSTASCNSSNIKTQESTSSLYKNFPKWSSTERLQNTIRSHQHYRTSCMDAKKSSTTAPVKSLFSPRLSEASPSKWKSFTSTPEKQKTPSPKQLHPASIPTKIDALKFVPFKFRIPRKVQAELARSSCGHNNSVSLNQNVELKSSKGGSEVVVKKSELARVKPCKSLAKPSSSPCKDQTKTSPLPEQLPPESPPAGDANCSFDQGQVAEELHLARCEKRLEVKVMQSYGELTAMDIDSPEEGEAETNCREPKQKTLILVLDTNILLSHLDYVKKIRSRGLEALGFPVVLIPWVVLQELDSLKNRKGLSGSVAHLAAPAISFIYTSLKKRDPHLWGQSMQQATQISNGLNTENNDDRVLQCCLQYQTMYPECALILCTNDKNLSSKAVLSGVRAFSKADLEAVVRRSKQSHHFLQSVHSPVLSRLSHNASSPALSTCSSPVRPPIQDSSSFSLANPAKEPSLNTKPTLEDNKETEWDLSGYLCELEECLQDVLSEVLETEMKAAYDDLWLEIVYIKPPWSLEDVLQCFKKHWIAVFGHLVPRKMSETVAKLINFFSSGETVSTLAFLQETKELVKAFGKSSKHIPVAITVIENIVNKLQSQHHVAAEQELSAGDVIMNDDDYVDKLPASVHVSPEGVWAVFENIWSQVYQTSLEVFKALSFDPHTMQAAAPMGRPSPPQDALACLHRLSSMVSQLLQAFSRVLSSTPGLEEVQTLLTIVYSNKLVSEDGRLTAKDLLDCFSQPDYREKLRVGGNQLLELKKALDGCVQTTGQNFAFTSQC